MKKKERKGGRTGEWTLERKEGIKKSMKEVKRKTVKERWKGR